MKRWENFQISSVEMGRILGDQKNRLQDESIKKSETIEKEVNKMYARYQQIKPKSQTLDREEVLDVYGRIKEWYMQWKEIETKIETIKNDVTNFNMKMPDFSVFDSTKRKLED